MEGPEGEAIERGDGGGIKDFTRLAGREKRRCVVLSHVSFSQSLPCLSFVTLFSIPW